MNPKNKLNRSLRWTLSIFLVLATLAAVLPHTAQAAEPAVKCAKTYTVQAGEGIRRIARENNMTLYRLARANNLWFPYTLTAGMSLCIPASPKPASDFKWTVSYTNSEIVVEGSNFPKQYTVYVKARLSDTASWIKLGKATSNKNGVLSAEFETPKALRSQVALTVCIKDGGTDALVCKRVYRR